MSPSDNRLDPLQKNILKNIDNTPRKASFKCKSHKTANQRLIKKHSQTTCNVKALTTKYNQMSQVSQQMNKRQDDARTNNCRQNCSGLKVTLTTKPKVPYPKPITTKDCVDTVQRNKKLVPKVIVDIDLNEVPISVPKHKGINENSVLTVKSAIQIFETNKPIKKLAKRTENVVVKARPIAKIKPILKKPEPQLIEEYKVKIIDTKKDLLKESEPEVKKEQYVKVEEVRQEQEVKLEEVENKMEDAANIFTQISRTKVDYSNRTNSLKRTEFKEKNSSSLFKKLSRKSQEQVVGEKKERPFVRLMKSQTSAPEEDNLKPNTSFLWAKTNDGVKTEPRVSRTDMPLPLPPVDFIPQVSEYSDRSELIYDDVNSFEVVSEQSDGTDYDDIDIYDEIKKLPNIVQCETVGDSLTWSDQNKVHYDDCEGDGYQYVTQEESKEDENVGNGEGNNEVCDTNQADDVSNIYESIYDQKNTQEYIVSDISDISSNSNKSTYEKSNSIYGISVHNNFKVSQGSLATSTSDESTSIVSSAHSQQRSDSTSDQWIDEGSDSEPELKNFVPRERCKKVRNSVSPSWSAKVRRQWNKREKSEDEPHLSDSDHLYESISEQNKPSTQSESLFDEDLIDDFDSNSSDEEPTNELPELPEKGLKKSLKQAGKILRRNFTLKKSDISFSTFKKKKKKSVEEIFADEKGKTSENVVNVGVDNINSDSSYSSEKNGKRTWRIKEKFKRNSVGSVTSNNDLNNENEAKNSTFYYPIDSKEIHPDGVQSKVYERSASETKMSAKRETQRRSVPAMFERTVTRPNIPPPPPPITDVIEYASLDDDSFKRPDSAEKHVEQTKRHNLGYSLYSTDGRKSNFFVTQQLYQLYAASVYQNEREEIINIDNDDDVDEFYWLVNEKRTTLDKKNELRVSRQNILQIRTLWCQVPEVVESQILASLSEQQKKLQEAKFEIITSEISYVNSLNVLISHFIKNLDNDIILKREFKMLFNNIPIVKQCAENFVSELERCWEEDIMLPNICNVVYNATITHFNCYVKFCKNQVHMEQTLTELLKKNVEFSSHVRTLESENICQNQTLRSFLMLPMQRITRLPLLVGAVLARLDTDHDEYQVCKAAFDLLNKIVKECDDELTKMHRCEDMLRLSQQLEFPSHIKSIPVITKSRYIVKQGSVQQLVTRDDSKLTFSKKFLKTTLEFFLFPDLLLITKKKSDTSYVVVDHCPRNLLQIESEDVHLNLPVKKTGGVDFGGKFYLLLTLLENYDCKEITMVLLFNEESDRQRWAEVLTPRCNSENAEECIYEEWDCPQYRVIDEFCATQSDELSLCIGDRVNILKKTSDGLAHGERLRDGAKGWFPLKCTIEIQSEHKRAKNKKQRYQVLSLSGKFIDSQMKIKN